MRQWLCTAVGWLVGYPPYPATSRKFTGISLPGGQQAVVVVPLRYWTFVLADQQKPDPDIPPAHSLHPQKLTNRAYRNYSTISILFNFSYPITLHFFLFTHSPASSSNHFLIAHFFLFLFFFIQRWKQFQTIFIDGEIVKNCLVIDVRLQISPIFSHTRIIVTREMILRTLLMLFK